jgi:hypothetical protein
MNCVHMLQTRHSDGPSAGLDLLNHKVEGHSCHDIPVSIVMNNQIAILPVFAISIYDIFRLGNKGSGMRFDSNLPYFAHLVHIVDVDIVGTNKQVLFVELGAIDNNLLVLRDVEHVLVAGEIRVGR